MSGANIFWRTVAALGVVVAMTASAWAVDTVWNFGGDLSAATGTATMSYRGDMGTSNVGFHDSEHDLGLPMPFGDNSGVMQFSAVTPTQGLNVNLNNGGATVGSYTMVWDVFRPGLSWEAWTPLYQTDVTNATDADFFINDGDGIGIEGQYHGVVANGNGNVRWNRIAVTRDAVTGTLKKYLDGQLVGTQTLSDSRWDITGGSFNIISDDNGESSGGYISSFRFVDNAMDQAVVEALGGVHANGANVAGQVPTADPATMTPGGFTIAILGDTQNYSSSQGRTDHIFKPMTQWLVDNKTARNIQFVAGVGDIVNSAGNESQWTRAMSAMSTFDGELPYAVVRGNHDVSPIYDRADRFGPGSPYSTQPTLAGSYPSGSTAMRNTYHTFEANGQKILLLGIDFDARDNFYDGGQTVIDWAQEVIEDHQDHRIILDTHAYMYDGGQWFDNTVDPNDPGGRTHDVVRNDLVRGVSGSQSSQFNPEKYKGEHVYDGKELWDELASQYENVALVITGHMFENRETFKYHLSQGIAGNDVHQMLINQQDMTNGGNGWIRLLEFDPDGQTVRVKTYSPYLDQWDTSPDVFYYITLPPYAGSRALDHGARGHCGPAGIGSAFRNYHLITRSSRFHRDRRITKSNLQSLGDGQNLFLLEWIDR